MEKKYEIRLIRSRRYGVKAGKRTGVYQVLLVDDDTNFLAEFKDLLEEYGFHVSLATDGEECLRMAQKSKPDLLLLDIAIPKLNGFDVIREFKSNPTLKHVPIVIVTGKTFEADVPQDCRPSVSSFFYKPFDLSTILSRMTELLSGPKLHY